MIVIYHQLVFKFIISPIVECYYLCPILIYRIVGQIRATTYRWFTLSKCIAVLATLNLARLLRLLNYHWLLRPIIVLWTGRISWFCSTFLLQSPFILKNCSRFLRMTANLNRRWRYIRYIFNTSRIHLLAEVSRIQLDFFKARVITLHCFSAFHQILSRLLPTATGCGTSTNLYARTVVAWSHHHSCRGHHGCTCPRWIRLSWWHNYLLLLLLFKTTWLHIFLRISQHFNIRIVTCSLWNLSACTRIHFVMR